MAFSFNWAGVNIPKIDAQPKGAANEIAANLGMAQWGSVVRDANEEYADMLASGGSVAEEVRRIQAEIARLEARNSEIRAGQAAAREQARQAQIADNERFWAGIEAENASYNMNGYRPNMAGYSQYMDEMDRRNQYMQGAASMLAALNAQNYRTR